MLPESMPWLQSVLLAVLRPLLIVLLEKQQTRPHLKKPMLKEQPLLLPTRLLLTLLLLKVVQHKKESMPSVLLPVKNLLLSVLLWLLKKPLRKPEFKQKHKEWLLKRLLKKKFGLMLLLLLAPKPMLHAKP
jgi:hypothetical protein